MRYDLFDMLRLVADLSLGGPECSGKCQLWVHDMLQADPDCPVHGRALNEMENHTGSSAGNDTETR